MKRTSLVMLLIIIAAMSYAISGTISSNTVWSEDVIVTGDLTVAENVTLTIQPGVNVYFPMVDQNADGIGDVNFYVLGRLVVQGTESEKVSFKSLEATPGKRDWGGIHLLTADNGTISSLSNLLIENAYRGLLVNGKGVTAQGLSVWNSFDYGIRVQASSSPSTFTNCDLRNGAGYGMQVEAGNVTITNILIYRHGSYGFKGMGTATLSVSGMNSTTNDGSGIWIANPSSATFESSRSVSNKHYGILIESGSPSFNNCQIFSNKRSGIKISGTSGTPLFSYCSVIDNQENGFLIHSRNPQITYSFIHQNRGSGITILNASPTVNYCNIFGNHGEELTGPDFNRTLADTEWRRTATGVTSVPASVATVPLYLNTITYRKDADNFYSSSYYYYQLYTRIVANTNHYLVDEYSFYTRYDHDMPQITVSGVVDQLILTQAALQIGIYSVSNTNNPRMWVSNMTMNHHLDKQVVVFNEAGVSANLQFNWWGQITGVNDLVMQYTPATANYATMQTSLLVASMSNLPNEGPSLSLLTPAVLTINPSTVEINFTAMDIDNNARIRLYYSTDQNFGGTLITDQLFEDDHSTYSWNVGSVSPGIYYVYGSIDDGSNPVVYSYAPERVVVGDFRVWIPNDLFASASDAISVPLKIRNVLPDYDIISYQLNITFNHNIVTFQGIQQDATLSNGWTLNYNNSVPGQIALNAFSTAAMAAEAGDLLILNFTINNNQADNQFTDLTISDCILNAGYPAPVTANGKITVYNKYNITGAVNYYSGAIPISNVQMNLSGLAQSDLLTDAEGSFAFAQQYYGNYTLTPEYSLAIPELVITPYDASLVARYALGLVTFDSNQIHAADVNADNLVSVYDAALIARYSVGIITELPAGIMKFSPASSSFTLNNVYTPRQFIGIAYGDPSGNWYDDARTTVHTEPQIVRTGADTYLLTLSADEPFYSYLLKLQYDPDLTEILDIEYHESVNGFQREVNHSDGSLAIASYGISPASSSEAIIRIRFSSSAEEPISVLSSFFDEQGTPYGWTSSDDPTTPAIVLLQQNYPNPFNPLTSISYSIPQASDVRLDIYNVKGQRVQSLVNSAQSAGLYTVQWNAQGFASGMYLYRLQVGNKVISRKMLLMK